jgi:hypothetical protein
MNWRVTLPITLNEQTRGVALAKAQFVAYRYTGRLQYLGIADAGQFEKMR